MDQLLQKKNQPLLAHVSTDASATNGSYVYSAWFGSNNSRFDQR